MIPGLVFSAAVTIGSSPASTTHDCEGIRLDTWPWGARMHLNRRYKIEGRWKQTLKLQKSEVNVYGYGCYCCLWNESSLGVRKMLRPNARSDP
ncbi:uncharacterized protein G2W53_038649 [Senna tora]|uniref:Uncharacterized protein n=1 Tax=Senna tora TaxID=362788 RepID=A0A834SPE7_9FABA|nr:uncharacterized protein G2W53_038649 [Senna tora]